MKNLTLIILTLLLFSGNVVNAGFSFFKDNIKGTVERTVNQVEKNVSRTDESFKKNSPPEPSIVQPISFPRLWIHVRGVNQSNEAENIFKLIADTKLGESSIEQKPLQIIDYGPEISQLRYFKKEDMEQAKELFTTLSELIPELKLKDFSDSYSDAFWLRPGHFELWLAPELTLVKPSE